MINIKDRRDIVLSFELPGVVPPRRFDIQVYFHGEPYEGKILELLEELDRAGDAWVERQKRGETR